MLNNLMFVKLGVNQFDGTCADYFFVEVENANAKYAIKTEIEAIWYEQHIEDFDNLVETVEKIPGVVRVRCGFPGTVVELY